ncbi:MAG: DUF2155 domain-containing protein [Gemmobacter sp.]
MRMPGVVLAAMLSVIPLAGPLAAAERGVEARGAVLRWLDKVSGQTGDLELSRGQLAEVGRLSILMDTCRYPAEGQPTEAFAHLVIMDNLRAEPVFSGWMIAEAPALSALDHHRYDVWVLRCLTE